MQAADTYAHLFSAIMVVDLRLLLNAFSVYVDCRVYVTLHYFLLTLLVFMRNALCCKHIKASIMSHQCTSISLSCVSRSWVDMKLPHKIHCKLILWKGGQFFYPPAYCLPFVVSITSAAVKISCFSLDGVLSPSEFQDIIYTVVWLR
jgi:hypothetical protein